MLPEERRRINYMASMIARGLISSESVNADNNTLKDVAKTAVKIALFIRERVAKED